MGYTARCGAARRHPTTKDHPGYTMICTRSAGHSVLKCWDECWGEDGYFTAPERVGFPKIQPLGLRKLRPIASELEDALSSLRSFIDPDDGNCSVPADVRKAAARYLSSWVEAPLSRALGSIDPRFRAEDQDGEIR